MRALVFDFDGLILDTETSVYEAWRATYADHGHELPLELWHSAIGTDGSSYDPLEHLRDLVDTPLDVEALQSRRRTIRDSMLAELSVMPGVEACLDHARQRGMRIGIASSSPLDWVAPHLERLELLEFFETIVTRDRVPSAKPAPDLYLRAVEELGVAPRDAIALEDSPNGVAAAKSAGLYCVAVPGPMTRGLSFDQADAVVPSLDAQPPDRWIARAAEVRGR